MCNVTALTMNYFIYKYVEVKNCSKVKNCSNLTCLTFLSHSSANESFCADACIMFSLKQMNKTLCHACSIEYDGTGYQYQLVAGPVFDNIFAVSAIFMGMLADFHHTKTFLCIFLVMWSVLIGITGLVKEYWQLALTRFGVAMG